MVNVVYGVTIWRWGQESIGVEIGVRKFGGWRCGDDPAGWCNVVFDMLMWAWEFRVASVAALFVFLVGWSYHELVERTGEEAGKVRLCGGVGIK